MDEDELKELDSGDDFMYISVTDPNKVGEGMSSFMAYKVVTRTNSNYFKKKEMVVTRRFSDFLGLHDKLAEKYRQNGRIIPPAPDKSVVGMTKVKIAKDGDEVQDEVHFEFHEKKPKNTEFHDFFSVCRTSPRSFRAIYESHGSSPDLENGSGFP